MARTILAIAILTVAGLSPAAAQFAARQNADRITVGIPKLWPPHYIAEDVPKPTGFAVEIMDAVAARAGYRIDYRIYRSFKQTMDDLYAGRIDVVPNVGIIPERRKKLSFSDPVETFVVSIFVRADTQDVARLQDLYGRRVGGITRNVGIRIMQAHPEIKSVEFGDVRTALFDLLAGRIDGLIYPAPVVTRLAHEIGIFGRIKTAGAPLREIKRGIAVYPSRPEIHRRLSRATRDFVGTAEYQQIYTKWFGEPRNGLSMQSVLIWGGIALAVLVLVFSLWHYLAVMRLNRTLERRVEDRTAALREAQDELVRKERLATLGRLTGTMAHELRNPLGAVVTSFEVIKRRARDTDGRLNSTIERAERGIERCTKIINELLEYAQVKLAQAPDFIAVDDLAAGALDEYEAPVFVTLERDLHAPDAIVSADADQLQRLLINFLDNGRDAIAEKTESGRAGRRGALRVATRLDGSEVEITVADDGVGITEEQMKKIFEPLYSTKPFGVGLGLPYAQNIVEQLGGELSLHSEPGLGTEVRVRLPLAADSTAAKKVA